LIQTLSALPYYLKYVTLTRQKAAQGDLTVEAEIDDLAIARLEKEAASKGKAAYELRLELKDENGVVVAKTVNKYQMRSHGNFAVKLPTWSNSKL